MAYVHSLGPLWVFCDKIMAYLCFHFLLFEPQFSTEPRTSHTQGIAAVQVILVVGCQLMVTSAQAQLTSDCECEGIVHKQTWSA